MWHTAERRFVRHVCLRNPFVQLLLGISIIHSLLEAGSWEQQHASPPLHCGCIMPIPSLQLQEKTCLMQRSRGLVTELWSPRIVTMQWLCSQLCYVTAANQWTVVEIELLATVGWKWGCQPFSCRCSQNVTHCRKEICSTCLFKESIRATPFGNFNHPLPTRSLSSRERQHVRQLCITLWLHHAHPFVAGAEKRHVSCREAEGLVTELWSPRIVTMQWLCSQLCYVTAANQWTVVEIELLATVGWKWGCQPFSCPCSQKGTHCRKEICSTCLSKESMPFDPFVKSKPPLPTRSLSSRERQCVRQLCISLWLHHAHPFVAAAEKGRKSMSYAEKQRVWSRSCGLQDLLQCSDCALSCAMWLLQTNELLSRLSF